MRDPYFGNRDVLTGDPIRDRDEWTEWDYILVSVYQLIQDLTNKHGLLAHEVENERMVVEAIKKHDKFQAAVDRATKGSKKKGYTPDPGEYFVPRLYLRGGDWPTLEEYWASQGEESEDD